MQHAYVIPWNGDLALQFITGQPQKGAAIEAIAFPACSETSPYRCGGVQRAMKEVLVAS